MNPAYFFLLNIIISMFYIGATAVITLVVPEESMMEKHSSYHGSITGDEAIRRLKYSGHPHCYLTRFSKERQKYMLTVYMHAYEDVVENFVLNIMHEKCEIEGKSKAFKNIQSLLKYYEAEEINPSLERIGQNYLLEDYKPRQKWIESKSLGGHSSYHDAITEVEAIERLEESGHDHCYLTHFSEEKQVYMLSVYRKRRSRDAKESFPIILLHSKYRIEGKADQFDNIDDLLVHYGVNSLNPSLHKIGHNFSNEEYDGVPNQEFQMEHDSYHDSITEEEAMNRLRQSEKPHCYLTYFSEENQKHMLAVFKKQPPDNTEEHFPITFKAGKYKIEAKVPKFDDAESLLDYYAAHRISRSLASIGTNYTLEEYDTNQARVENNMMGEHTSYHNQITPQEAMNRLKKSGRRHCYLTYFNREQQKYVLAVYEKREGVEIHYSIIIRGGMHKLEGKPGSFNSIDELLQHYTENRVDPALSRIGENYTLEAYNDRFCIIL